MKKAKGILEAFLGSDQFSGSKILGMLAPLVLDQLFIYTIALLTTAMISSSGQDSVTAVSLVTPIVYLETAILIAFSAGGAVVVAQYKGHGDEEKTKNAIGQTVLIVFLLALIISLVYFFLAGPIIELFFSKAEETVKEKAVLYLRGMALNNLIHAPRVGVTAGLRGVGDIKENMKGSLLINVSFFFFCLFFINYLHLDILGTLISYALARFLGLLTSVYFLFFKPGGHIRISLKMVLKPMTSYLRTIIRLAIPFSAEEVFFHGGTILVSSYLVLLGTQSVAAHAILNAIFSTLYAPTVAVGLLSTTVVGQCIGAGKRELARFYGKRLVHLGYLISFFSVLVLSLAIPLIIRIYQPTPEAEALVKQIMTLGFAGVILLYAPSCIFPYVLKAAKDAYYSTFVSLASMWLLRVGLGYILCIPLQMGLLGAWAAMLLEWAVRFLLYGIRFHQGRWLSKKSVAEEG